jgi:hypothetical protein
MINPTSRTTNAITIGIQTGANTQTQDQAIIPVSFKTMNTIVNKPKNEIPVLFELFCI